MLRFPPFQQETGLYSRYIPSTFTSAEGRPGNGSFAANAGCQSIAPYIAMIFIYKRAFVVLKHVHKQLAIAGRMCPGLNLSRAEDTLYCCIVQVNKLVFEISRIRGVI